MRKMREYILKEKEIFVGLEDSKRTWKLCVRSNGVVIHETGMPAKYDVLHNYFRNKFPECTIKVMYEAGFRGFSLHDQLIADGWECIVTPPHTVTEEKCQRKKNDKIDCRRLAKNLENNDYRSCFVPDKELREDRQISRVYGQIKKRYYKNVQSDTVAHSCNILPTCLKRPPLYTNHYIIILRATLILNLE